MKKSKKAKAGKGTAAKPAKVRRQISASKLRSLMATARSTYKDVREIAGGFGAEVKNAAEHDHLNKKAFAILRGLDRLEPEKLADALDALDYYLDVGGLRKRASQVQRLPLGGEDEEGGAPDTEEPRQGARAANVRPFPQPAGIAAE